MYGNNIQSVAKTNWNRSCPQSSTETFPGFQDRRKIFHRNARNLQVKLAISAVRSNFWQRTHWMKRSFPVSDAPSSRSEQRASGSSLWFHFGSACSETEHWT